jgi:hypothetical protein
MDMLAMAIAAVMLVLGHKIRAETNPLTLCHLLGSTPSI